MEATRIKLNANAIKLGKPLPHPEQPIPEVKEDISKKIKRSK